MLGYLGPRDTVGTYSIVTTGPTNGRTNYRFQVIRYGKFTVSPAG